MRIVITKLGKTEIKDDEYKFNMDNNNKSFFRNASVSYNKIKNNIYLKGSQTSRKIVSIPKIRYNKFPTISKTSDKINNLFTNDKNNLTSFLPKIKDTLSPRKSNSSLNDSKRIIKKAIKVNQKKLNIPNNMLDKYANKIIIDDIFKKEEETTKVNHTENNLFSENNKVFSLRDILIPKNKKKLDETFLDTKFDINRERSIINYLQKDKTISPFYIQKVSQMKNGQLLKMDKICQKYLNDEMIKNKLDNTIKKKIKIGYEKEAIKYEKDLKNMNDKLSDYNTIYQILRLKKENYENYKLMYLSSIK